MLFWCISVTAQDSLVKKHDCTERFSKLEKLSLEYFDLPDVVNARNLQKKFYAKLTHAYMPTVSHGDNRLQWLKKNWKRTKFRSFAQAKADYDKMIAAESAVDAHPKIIAIRADFEEVYRQCGSKLYADFILSLKKKYAEKFYPAN